MKHRSCAAVLVIATATLLSFPPLGGGQEKPKDSPRTKTQIVLLGTGMSAQEFSYADKDLWVLAAFIRKLPNVPPQVLSRIRQKSGSPATEPTQ